MATYPYICDSCGHEWSFQMSMKDYDYKNTFVCPECESENTRREMTVPYVTFAGDGWASKNNRIKGQMRAKNKRLDAKERERKGDGAGGVSLAPNVDGKRTDSWSDAVKLAKSQGKDTTGYQNYARKEKLRKSGKDL